MDAEHFIVLCTCPDQATADEIADTLVDHGCAACVSILPGVTSVYSWQGKVHRDTELQLLVKTTRDAYREAEETIQRLHPYELPEILAVPVAKGQGDYLQWITIQTHKDQ